MSRSLKSIAVFSLLVISISQLYLFVSCYQRLPSMPALGTKALYLSFRSPNIARLKTASSLLSPQMAATSRCLPLSNSKPACFFHSILSGLLSPSTTSPVFPLAFSRTQTYSAHIPCLPPNHNKSISDYQVLNANEQIESLSSYFNIPN